MVNPLYHTCIFKSGNKNSVKNCRPISLLCNTSKVLEKIIYNKTIEFVSKSISSSQFSALKVRSTIQQLYLSLHHVVNSTMQTDVIYLDIQKAFAIFVTESCLLSFGLLKILVVYGDGSNVTYPSGLKLSELAIFYLLPYQFFLEFPSKASSEYNIELQSLF